MKTLLAATLAILALLALSTVLVSAAGSVALATPGCHNATGSCTKTHFVCANEELVAHSAAATASRTAPTALTSTCATPRTSTTASRSPT